jgi:hypothetical protein
MNGVILWKNIIRLEVHNPDKNRGGKRFGAKGCATGLKLQYHGSPDLFF